MSTKTYNRVFFGLAWLIASVYCVHFWWLGQFYFPKSPVERALAAVNFIIIVLIIGWEAVKMDDDWRAHNIFDVGHLFMMVGNAVAFVEVFQGVAFAWASGLSPTSLEFAWGTTSLFAGALTFAVLIFENSLTRRMMSAAIKASR